MGIAVLKSEDVRFIAIHCSASQPKADLTAADIDRMHRQRGFIKIGYHFVIRRDGTVEAGRSLTQRGAHVEDWNHCSIGVCLVGGVNAKLKPEANFTPEQYHSLVKVLEDLKKQFPNAKVQGHRDFPGVNKVCPSFDVALFVSDRVIRP